MRSGKDGVFNRVGRFFRAIYLKVARINDTPQKIALGFGLGVFIGVLPGVGPVIALLAALLFKVNRAAALLGSILMNTWTAIPLFLVAVNAGGWMTGTSGGDIRREWGVLVQDFHWIKVFEVTFLKMAFPVAIGYVVISFGLGVVAYGIALVVANRIQRKKQGRD